MFTGIIETIGNVKNIEKENSNLHFTIESSISDMLKVDQSISHNGVCLTVTALAHGEHRVTAIQETLMKSNLSLVQIGDVLNLERCTLVGSRLDGHIVQGHVDQVAVCTSIEDVNGSWLFTFQYDSSVGNVTVEKGSIAVNGISLTVVNSGINTFSVAIIPYTYENTAMHTLKEGDKVNLEFDIIGKYVARLMSTRN